MTRRVRGGLRVEPESPRQCEVCGTVAELRPYGPNGESICFQCGMADEETTKAQFVRRVTGIDTVFVGERLD